MNKWFFIIAANLIIFIAGAKVDQAVLGIETVDGWFIVTVIFMIIAGNIAIHKAFEVDDDG